MRLSGETRKGWAVVICRLAGFSLGQQDEVLSASDIAYILFPLMTRGGPHAYGWATTRGAEDSEVDIVKFAGRSDTILAGTRIDTEFDPQARVALLHTRWATHGSPLNMLNNHPVHHGHIVGCHNGVLWNHETILKTTGRQNAKTEVDSEAIFAAVNKWGHNRGLAKIKGDMVATYLDIRKPNIVHIARSMGRYLTIGWTERGGLFWASERWMLETLEDFGIKFRSFSKVTNYKHLTIRQGKVINRAQFYTPTYLKAQSTHSSKPTYYTYPKTNEAPKGSSQSTPQAPQKTYKGRIGAMQDYMAAIRNGGGRAIADARQKLSEEMRDTRPERFAALDKARADATTAADPDETLVEANGPVEVDGSLYLYNGQYLTADEYVAVVRDEMEWAYDELVARKGDDDGRSVRA